MISPALRWPKSIHSYNPIPNGRVFYINPALVKNPVFKSLDPFGHTCTVTGTTKPNDVWVMDGDDVITCGNNTVFDLTNAITVITWGKPGASADTKLVSKDYDGAANTPYSLQFQSLKPRFFSYKASSVIFAALSDDVVTVNTWHCIAGTFDGANGIVYADGVSKKTAAYAGTMPVTTTNILIGKYSTAFYTGSCGEVWIYNRVLTPGEIEFIYLATRWRYQ